MKLDYQLLRASQRNLGALGPGAYDWDWDILWLKVQHFARVVFDRLKYEFINPPDWIVPACLAVDNFFREHTFVVHTIAWSIFFGPIVLLLPLLLLHESGIAIVHSLSFLSHGLIPYTSYYTLRDSLADSKESISATIESWTATFNKRTTAQFGLLLFRVAAGLVGVYVLVGITWWPVLGEVDWALWWEVLVGLGKILVGVLL